MGRLCQICGNLFGCIRHLPLSEDWVRFIYSFHIPLFFFISGYLHKASESSYESLKANVRSLLIPYMLLYFIFWLYPICKDLLSGNFSLSGTIIKPFLGLCMGNGYSAEWYTMLNIPLYFLIALFWVRVAFDYYCHYGSYVRLFCIVFCFLFVVFKAYSDVDLIWSIDSALMAFPFFVLGDWISKHSFFCQFLMKKRTILYLSIFFYCLFIEIVLSNINGRVDVNHCLYGNNILLFYLQGCIGILMVISISSLFNKNSFVQMISNGTILIIAFGSAAASIVLRMFRAFVLNENILSMIAAFGALVILFPLIIIVQRKFPLLMGKRTKSYGAKS